MSEKKPKVTIQSKAETIQNEKTQKQNQEALEIEKRKKEADQKADEARAEAEETLRREQEKIEAEKQRIEAMRRRQEEEQKRYEAEKKKLEEERSHEELLAAGAAVAGTVVAGSSLLSAGKNGTLGSFFKGFLAGILLGAAGCFFLTRPKAAAPMPAPAPIQEADVVIQNNGILGYTAADFQDAVLEGASEHQELIVMEQPLSITTTITKAGLGSFAVFSKMKDVTYYGTGVYTVDLSHIDKEHINVDEAGKTVYVTIPHSTLQYVNTDVNRTEFEDTEKGFLAIGDIKLTPEETKELESAVYDSMHERLDRKDLYDEADRFAILKTWEIFQPLITAVSPEFKVEMVFES